MKIEELYNIAEQDGIMVNSFNLKDTQSMSIMIDEKCFIAINPFCLLSYRDEKMKLSHELGHCEMGAFYNRYSALSIRSQSEYRATLWQIKKLIPKNEYEKALKKGYVELWELAEYFEVTEDLVKKAVGYYSKEISEIA